MILWVGWRRRRKSSIPDMEERRGMKHILSSTGTRQNLPSFMLCPQPENLFACDNPLLCRRLHFPPQGILPRSWVSYLSLQAPTAFCTNLFFFLLFRAALTAYGGSQARSQIRTTAASHSHSHSNSYVFDLHHSSWQHWTLNLLSEARDRTCILLDRSWVH